MHESFMNHVICINAIVHVYKFVFKVDSKLFINFIYTVFINIIILQQPKFLNYRATVLAIYINVVSLQRASFQDRY